MLNSINDTTLTYVFLSLLAVSVLSALFLLHPRVPLKFVHVHVGIITLPPIVALLALMSNNGSRLSGLWRLDSLSWLLAFFVLTIGLIVQRYSVRYLLGDHSYLKYFSLLTLTTTAGALAWFSNDLRSLVVCWGAALLGLILLIRLKKEWKVARSAAFYAGRVFALSWLFLLLAVIWIANSTGHWQLSMIFARSSLAHLSYWEKNIVNLLLVGAVVIPAAQWPFHRWLLDSVVAPTPVSAVMHAGIVNAGGIILTRFAPLFSGNTAQIFLLLFSSISVLLGTGIMLVHVDYKRQLVGSTIAQMGFMLIQCALGAYLAAIIHAVLHGLFKSTLFLQAGSAARHNEAMSRPVQSSSLLTAIGGFLGLLVAGDYLLTYHEGAYQLVSALTLGWSMSFAWTQLVAFGQGHIGRIAGFSFLTVGAIVYSMIHSFLYGMIHATVGNSAQAPAPVAIILLLILLTSSAAGAWLAHHRSSTAFAVIYLWLVRLGEPKMDVVESHPKYLVQSLSHGGHLR